MNDIVMPDRQSVEKCIFGIIVDLDDVFEDLMYCREHKQRESDGRCRTITPHPVGYYFLSGSYTNGKVQTWMQPPATGGHLRAKPHYDVEKRVRDLCTASSIGGFEIIDWPKAGHSLIKACDTHYIANPWLGFIKTDRLPIIMPSNTKIWDGKGGPICL